MEKYALGLEKKQQKWVVYTLKWERMDTILVGQKKAALLLWEYSGCGPTQYIYSVHLFILDCVMLIIWNTGVYEKKETRTKDSETSCIN